MGYLTGDNFYFVFKLINSIPCFLDSWFPSEKLLKLSASELGIEMRQSWTSVVPQKTSLGRG